MFNYLPKEKRKTILYICDDIRTHSGVATISKEIIYKSAHYYNWLVIGGVHEHPQNGQRIDMSLDINKTTGLTDSYVHQICTTGYGNVDLVKSVLKTEKIDALMIMTDPRYYEWLFTIERDIRRKIPLVYLNIWDNYPYPMYNKSFYESCDALLCISKLTKNCVEQVLDKLADSKVIKYVPHGLDEKIFYPIDSQNEELKNFKNDLFKGVNYEFTVLWNSRNIQRKKPSDLILAWKYFCDNFPKEKRKKFALVFHTDVIDPHGTNLLEIKKLVFGKDDSYNLIFTDKKFDPKGMNLLYNSVDAVSLISSNEGWGLSLTEALLCGKPIIGNVTGGIQDQMRFEDEKGEWINFNKDFPSNNFGKYKECGKWAFPVFPSNTSMVGSLPTPYIFDDRVQPEDVAEVLKLVHSFPKEKLQEYGKLGREWAVGTEANFTATNMTNTIIEGIEETLLTFTPRSNYDLIKA